MIYLIIFIFKSNCREILKTAKPTLYVFRFFIKNYIRSAYLPEFSAIVASGGLGSPPNLFSQIFCVNKKVAFSHTVCCISQMKNVHFCIIFNFIHLSINKICFSYFTDII